MDIVERLLSLRLGNEEHEIVAAAMDEIERLREALKFYVEIDEQYFPKVKSKAAAALNGDE